MLGLRTWPWTSWLLLGALAGCATPASLDPIAEVPYCHKNNKGRPLICTSANAPSLLSDAEAKRFEPDPTALTVFVVRRIWADGRNVLKVSIDDRIETETVPRSMVRLKLAPGRHVFSFEFDGTRHSTVLDGAVGEVRFIGLSGSVWAWKSSFDWATESEAAIRRRAARSRLVADLVAR